MNPRIISAELLTYLFNTLVVTVIVSLAVIVSYRRFIRRSMEALSGTGVSVPTVSHRSASSPVGPRLAEIPGTQNLIRREGVSLALEAESRLRRKIIMANGAAIFPSALILSCEMLYMGDLQFLPSRVLAITGVYGSAIFPILWATLALSAGYAFGGWLVYLVAVAAMTGTLSLFQGIFANSADLSRAGIAALMTFGYAGVSLYLPFLLMLATGWRVWRGVAPIIFSGLLVFGLAPFAGIHINDILDRTAFGGRLLLQTVNWVGLHGVFLALSLPAGYLAWWRIRSLTLAFERKEFSDAQLLIRGWWLMFILTLALMQAGSDVDKVSVLIAASTVAYWGFLKLSVFLLKRSRLNEARLPPKSLLLLRVFGFQRRTERLFDRLIARWRLFGGIHMIAGVDLAGRTIDPGDFLRFMTGTLDEYFVKGAGDLAQKLNSLDRAPDHDGRYRVTEFFCHENTWQASLVGLLEHSDIVLMDLRGFSEQKKGCEFELRQIAARMPLERVLVVVDSATDLALLERSLAGGIGTLRFARMEKQSSREIDRLFLALLDMPAGSAPGIANS